MWVADRLDRLEAAVRLLAKCPKCRGTGKAETRSPISHSMAIRVAETECQTCSGTGKDKEVIRMMEGST